MIRAVDTGAPVEAFGQILRANCQYKIEKGVTKDSGGNSRFSSSSVMLRLQLPLRANGRAPALPLVRLRVE